ISFFSSGRRHTRSKRDWSSDVCSSDLPEGTVTKTIPFKGGSKSSKIKFRAEKGHRVYLHSVKVKSGGGFTMVALDGYPRRVGDEIGRASCREACRSRWSTSSEK